jgi:isopentenyldiphosphate isomerase
MFLDMHPSEPAEELLQCYDERGNLALARPRSIVKTKPYRYWYAITNIWVVNDKAELMVSKRSDQLSGNPGKWQSYFGGHVTVGASMRENAVKELAEEAGLRVKPEELYLIAAGRDDQNMRFFELYAYRFNGHPNELHFTDGEVTDAKWMSMDKYWGEKETYPERWCNSCSTEFQKKIRDWINDVR